MHVVDSGILLYAKKAGITSFSSLWEIKQALKTKKVGHTGTLDSFAEGLLVVLSGSMTRLVSHITNFDKTYEAILCFGAETDTLDPTGTIIKSSSLPSLPDLQQALTQFTGEMSQIPPSYSAIQIKGKRASDLAREGKIITLSPRKIHIYALELIAVDCEDAVRYAHIRVDVSKGTYIRSLARDIAYACSSCAHLVRLRRTKLGPFTLNESCFNDELEPFSLSLFSSSCSHTDAPLDSVKLSQKMTEKRYTTIQNALMSFSEDKARLCNFHVVILKTDYEKDFMHGKPLIDSYFTNPLFQGNNAVFLKTGELCGFVLKTKLNISYSFVLPSAFREKTTDEN